MAIQLIGTGLKDQFLTYVCERQMKVFVYLISGIKLHGVVEQFDDLTLVLRNVQSQIVFQHAISTIVPAEDVVLND